jgi:hypothetical protein
MKMKFIYHLMSIYPDNLTWTEAESIYNASIGAHVWRS